MHGALTYSVFIQCILLVRHSLHLKARRKKVHKTATRPGGQPITAPVEDPCLLTPALSVVTRLPTNLKTLVLSVTI